MIAVLFATLLQLQAPAGADTVPVRVSPEAEASAYLDASARELVLRARRRQQSTAREITGYEAIGRERITVGLQALGRERLFYRREVAARIDWRRDERSVVEVLGAREVLPAFMSKVQLPGDLRSDAPGLAFDPAGENMFDALLSGGRGTAGVQLNGGDGNRWFKHPLAVGSEAYYRFRSGETTNIRLHDGAVIRLHELQVLPRRRDSQLLHGSVWIDAETHSPVRIVMRLARPFDLELDSRRMDPEERSEASEVPRIFRPIRGDLRLLTVEYALWRDETAGSTARWWLPRLFAVDAIAEVNTMPDFPVRFERAYSDVRVVGTGAVALDSLGAPLRPAQCRPRRARRTAADSASVARDTAAVQSTGRTIQIRVAGDDSTRIAEARTGEACRCTDGHCRLYEVRIPTDTATLLASEFLPPSPFSSGEELVTGEQFDRLAEQLRALSPAPWGFQPPLVQLSYLNADLVRFNRVEGLSLGARVDADFAAFSARATARLGAADLQPNGELALTRPGNAHQLELAVFRRLVPVEPGARSLGLGNSVTALLFGLDDGDYYRTLGAELSGRPARGARAWYDWRLFAERQRTARKETDWSLAHALDRGRTFRENVEADDADQLGAALALRAARGLNPVGLRWGAELALEAAAGDYGYARPALTLSSAFPLAGAFVGALEAAAGTSFGDLPVQRHWYVGGRGTARGYPGGAAVGTAFWRGPAEVANSLPGARLVLHSDVAWAGDRGDIRLDPALVSAGVGASFLDGLVRLDLSRALRGQTGWRFTAYVDGNL